MKVKVENLTTYIDIDWSAICDDFNLESGDISIHQTLVIDSAKEQINKVLTEFIAQNQK